MNLRRAFCERHVESHSLLDQSGDSTLLFVVSSMELDRITLNTSYSYFTRHYDWTVVGAGVLSKGFSC